MATNKLATTIRIEEALYEKVKYIAEKELRSVNSQLEFFILKGVETYEKKNGAIFLPEE